jgi:ketosteroid isomerase-like protein
VEPGVLWNQAELKKDAKALDQVLADRFIYTDIDGSLERKPEFLESVRNPTEHITSIGTESMSVEVYSDTVIAYGVYVEKGTSNGKPYLHHGRFTDTWIKQGQQWRCVSSHATLMHK